MPKLVLDFDPPQPQAPDFGSETSDLVYFLSWAFSARFGASHELSVIAEVLRTEMRIDLRPLLTYADRVIEEPSDQSLLDNAWQDAAPLADCCRDVLAGMAEGDQRFETLDGDYPRLKPALAELGEIAAWADQQGARIRITYLLEEPA